MKCFAALFAEDFNSEEGRENDARERERERERERKHAFETGYIKGLNHSMCPRMQASQQNTKMVCNGLVV